jgi:hypothetical protein
MSAVAPSPVEVRPVRPATADSVSAGCAPGPSDDSWRLMLLFAVFVVAPFVVVAAVWAVAAIGTLWALVLALAVYLAVTVFVCATVAFVLSDRVPLGTRSHHGR